MRMYSTLFVLLFILSCSTNSQTQSIQWGAATNNIQVGITYQDITDGPHEYRKCVVYTRYIKGPPPLTSTLYYPEVHSRFRVTLKTKTGVEVQKTKDGRAFDGRFDHRANTSGNRRTGRVLYNGSEPAQAGGFELGDIFEPLIPGDYVLELELRLYRNADGLLFENLTWPTIVLPITIK